MTTSERIESITQLLAKTQENQHTIRLILDLETKPTWSEILTMLLDRNDYFCREAKRLVDEGIELLDKQKAQ